MSTTSEKYKTNYLFQKVNDTVPIVFIHGVGLTKEIWEPQLNFFKKNNIITYDLLGHGKTPLEKTQLNLDDFARQLLNLINELEIDKIHLVGHSIGALVARNFASKHSYRLNSLTLYASIYKRSDEQMRVIENRFELMKSDKPASKDRSVRRWFTENYLSENKDMYSKIFNILDNNDIGNLLRTYKLFVRFQDDDLLLKSIDTKTLIITGQYDVGSTPKMSQELAKIIKNSEYVEIPNGKHLCNIECSEVFNKALEKFIDKNYDQI